MAQGRRRLEWAQTADLLAMQFNGFFRPETAAKSEEFNPTVPQQAAGEDIPQVPLSFLRHVFVGK